MCQDAKEVSVLNIIEKARKAQQKFDMNNDVQLEIDFEGPDEEFAEKT